MNENDKIILSFLHEKIFQNIFLLSLKKENETLKNEGIKIMNNFIIRNFDNKITYFKELTLKKDLFLYLSEFRIPTFKSIENDFYELVESIKNHDDEDGYNKKNSSNNNKPNNGKFIDTNRKKSPNNNSKDSEKESIYI